MKQNAGKFLAALFVLSYENRRGQWGKYFLEEIMPEFMPAVLLLTLH
jgi:hypothetical protein